MPKPTPPRRPRRRLFARTLLAAMLFSSLFAAFWFGLVPQRFSPFAPISLSQPGQWFVDLRLATLRHDQALCRSVIASPTLDAAPVADMERQDGCGWRNAVRVDAMAGAALPIGTITCEMAAALALWIAHDVQPLAERHMGQRVTRIEHMGAYACRNIIGSKTLSGFRSQHASANALDISAFRLADGRTIRLARDWRSSGPQATFLREIHRSACRVFRVALSPDFNEAHRDHFHFDRGPFATCR